MTYDYVCTACAHAWEAEQRITAEPIRQCPECGRQTAKRQVSGGQGFILKGGGWYSDLYSSAKPAASDKTAQDSKSENKTSKPADKSTGGNAATGTNAGTGSNTGSATSTAAAAS